MNVDLLVVSQGAVPVLRVFAARVVEETGGYGFSNGRAVLPPVVVAAHDGETESVGDLKELLLRLVSSEQGARLHEVFEAPSDRLLVFQPRAIDVKQGEVVALALVEPRLLLVGKALLLPRPVEDTLDLEHRGNGQDLVGALQVYRCQEHL